jgi:N-acetylneuraminic acid mutarotase
MVGNRLILLIILVGLALAGVWGLSRPVVNGSGVVETQIRDFGPQVRPALAATSAFTQTAGGYQPKAEPPAAPAGLKPPEAQAWMAFAQRHGGDAALVPTFPERYCDGVQVRGNGMTVSLRPLGSTAARGQIENGKLVYHNAYPSTDSLNVVSQGKSEEFLLLRDGLAPRRFEYDVSAASGVTNISLSDNAVHFTNAQGQQMEIEAPWLIESGGQKSASAVHWELSYPNGDATPRLALVVADAGKLHYPVVIDPTWVNTNGSMATSRYGHTATLLNNGLVLVAGGYTSGVGYVSSCELFNPATGLWTSAHSMGSVRFAHTATLLRSGKVLVAGGYNGSSTTNTAELYDPTSNTWATANSFGTARDNHTATLLGDGTVLVVGGGGSSGTNDVEVYNPGSNSWSATTHLITGRLGHTATLLANGSVLVAGGESSTTVNHVLNSAEVFSNGVWTSTGTMVSTRISHTATLLPNGKVLIVGGEDTNGNTLKTAELFTPSGTNGTWAATGSLTTARNSHTATLLPNGTVLVAGGQDSSGSAIGTAEIFSGSSWSAGGTLVTARDGQTATLLPGGLVLLTGGDDSSNNTLASAEVFNPASGTWAATGNLGTGRELFTATLLPNGQVLAAGGYSNGTRPTTTTLYNPSTGSWTATGTLNFGRDGFTATLLPNGKVLVAGGIGVSGDVAIAELYDPSAGTWTTTGTLSTARDRHTATLLPSGQVLVAGGEDSGGADLASAELYNPATGRWTGTGSLATARNAHSATLLPNGHVLVAGGSTGESATASAELYDPDTGQWTVTNSLGNARQNHTATLLPNGQVLVAGGDQFGTIQAVAELYNPGTGSWTPTGTLTTARTQHTATLLPSGQVLVAGGANNNANALTSTEVYNPASGIWTANGSLNTARYNHTAALLPNGQVLVAGGVVSGAITPTSELFNSGLGYTSATQPQLSGVSSASSTSALALTGSNFTGVSEASGGSASNIPVVQLEFLGNEQVINVPLSSSSGFTSSTFTSLNVTGGVPGYALLTMFVNGTPSVSQILSYTMAAQTITNFPSSQTLSVNPPPLTFASTTSDGMTITYTVESGPATVSGDTVTFTGSGTVVLLATAAGDGTYAPLYATDTITIPAILRDTPTLPPWALGLLALLLLAAANSSGFGWRGMMHRRS